MQRIERLMLYWTLVVMVIAIVAGVFGFGTTTGDAATVAKAVCAVSVSLFAVLLLGSAMKQ
jgi:uncharacterized membrane protein YtjA (UPF0391 family)